MRLRTQVHLAMLLAAICTVPAVAHAGQSYHFSGAGGRMGYASPEDMDGTVMIGGHVEFEQRGSRLHLQPNFLYWRYAPWSNVNPNLDVYYHFEHGAGPYLGGGIGLSIMNDDRPYRSGESDLAANFIGGLRFPGHENNVFVEGRFTASQVSQISLLGGITFGVH